MAEERPYFLRGRVSLTGSAAGSISFDIGASEHFEAMAMRIAATSESFDLTGISDQGGVPYTNASQTDVIDGKLLFNTTENEYNEIKFAVPWNLPPNTTLKFDLIDTSTSTNEIFIVLIGKMKSV